MKFRVDRKTPFPRDAVFAWWTDFREDDHLHPGSPSDSTRTILGRTGNEVWLRDRATRPMRVTIDERVILNPPLGYAVDARYPPRTSSTRTDSMRRATAPASRSTWTSDRGTSVGS